MRVLGNYNRENPYADDLNKVYDIYVAFGIDKILMAVDMVRNGAPDPCTSLHEWLEDNTPDLTNPEYIEMVSKEFTHHFRTNFDCYINCLNRFVRELSKEERTIKFELERQIKCITEDEIKISKDEDYLIDRDINELEKHCWQLMPGIYQDLANRIRADFNIYLDEGVDFENSLEDEGRLKQVSEKVVLLNELGIIDFLKERYPELKQSPSKLSSIVGIILDGYSDTLRKAIGEIDKKGKESYPYKKANPYNSPDTLRKVRSKLMRYIDEKYL